MNQTHIAPPSGARKERKRVGRGYGSGHGTYACRGMKGQQSRSGPGPRPGFEGGQLPIVKRLPEKRGFKNIFKVEYSLVNLKSLAAFPAHSQVTPEELHRRGIIKSLSKPLKILGDGELTQPLVVVGHGFSAAARRKIQAAGGKVEVIRHAGGSN
ncbi:MAG: 50S ribosomal protein L15 [Chloroflexi bacterium]|nr:50S ribosomal protein L15 [Chloroflexota bacterium]